MTERDGMERAAKLMAWRGWCSRREAERLILGGQVTVDGEVLEDPGRRVPLEADIVIQGRGQERLQRQTSVLLHKPVGIVSTQPEGTQTPAWKLLTADRCIDGSAEGVAQVLAKPWTCAVCGRLDQDSRGLLVLSQDGRLAKRITGGSAWKKQYLVTVAIPPGSDHILRLRDMRDLDGEDLLPMQVNLSGTNQLTFILRQGRRHQIRRACAKVGLEVVDLYRERIGPWSIEGLGEGQWRVVSRAEVDAALTPHPEE